MQLARNISICNKKYHKESQKSKTNLTFCGKPVKTKNNALKTFDMFNFAFHQYQKFDMQLVITETRQQVDKKEE